VALVGGLDSLGGAVVAALIISLLEVVVTTYYNPNLARVIPYAILLIVLIFRPWGFFGTEEEIERV
jgi:branched-chain amino acid transport system permease protein